MGDDNDVLEDNEDDDDDEMNVRLVISFEMKCHTDCWVYTRCVLNTRICARFGDRLSGLRVHARTFSDILTLNRFAQPYLYPLRVYVQIAC